LGSALHFWGGVDTQHVLPFGTPGEVRAETARRIQDLGQNGGHVLCSAHNIQNDVPVEYIVAMYETARGTRLAYP